LTPEADTVMVYVPGAVLVVVVVVVVVGVDVLPLPSLQPETAKTPIDSRATSTRPSERLRLGTHSRSRPAIATPDPVISHGANGERFVAAFTGPDLFRPVPTSA
jgi:hypothetical protein